MSIEIKGLPVVKEYYNDELPQITNGLFKLINTSSQTAHIEIFRVEVIVNDHALNVDYFVYSLPDYIELNKKNVCVEKENDLEIDISFQFIKVENILSDTVFVRMHSLNHGKKTYADSQVKFINRIKQ